jgi:ABC-2 type transport system permease protein
MTRGMLRSRGAGLSLGLRDELRLLPHVVAYEWRKATAFRAGFFLREMLRGVARPAVMMVVYLAMFHSSGASSFRGYALGDLLAYLVWSSVLQKCITEERTLDIGEQIFDGYITKYLVMPVSFFTLVWGQFIQFTLLQLFAATLYWCVGALLLPGFWPNPVSAVALAQASLLLLLGAGCYLLAHFILNCLAFWLDVVWSLLGMFRFVALFISGALVPIGLMPDWVHRVLIVLFPYWTVCAPAEILLGRQGTPQFLQGIAVLGVSLVVLQGLAVLTWKRGLLRYSGVGA